MAGKNTNRPTNENTNETSRVIDLNEVRTQRLEDKRRKTERVFMNQFLGVYCMTGNNSMHQIEVVDVSDEGLGFQVPVNSDKPSPITEKNFPIRLYFNQESFLQVHVSVQNTRPAVQAGTRYTRYGCAVDPSTSTFEAYQAFVKFLKAYGNVSQKDKGDVNVFFV
ncbi:MAG: hypothetical protein H7301_09620 [Cryobacterium sp.]|nr:hypothetical protein [Oligoflexia bacterium]